MSMSDQKEVVREIDGGAEGAKSPCCGPSCCGTAESASGKQKDPRETYMDAAKQATNEDKSPCCASSCCS